MMRAFLLIILLVFGVNGCAKLTSPGNLMYRLSQRRNLSDAVSLLEQGNTDAAVAQLTSICAGPDVPGVTDEALFRLSLLHLGGDQELGNVAQSQQELKRLSNEFPASSWAQMSLKLSKTLDAMDGTRQQFRRLSGLNDSLGAENRELNNLNHSLMQKNRELKGSNTSLVEESVKRKELINSLTKENTELRRSMEQLKALDLELERKIKR